MRNLKYTDSDKSLPFLQDSFNNTLQITKAADMFDVSSIFDREIYIDAITPKVADIINQQIKFWNKIDKESMIAMTERRSIKIFINSTGGSYTAMLQIMDSIKLSKTPIYTIVTGIAYKQAFFIFLAGHKRYMYPHATLLFTETLNITEIAETQLGNTMAFAEMQGLELKEYLLDKTAINEGVYNKITNSNNWYFNAEEAIKYKICNSIIKDLDFIDL